MLYLSFLSFYNFSLDVAEFKNQRVPEGSRGFQRVPEGTDRTVGMAMISGINQLGPQKFKVQVS